MYHNEKIKHIGNDTWFISNFSSLSDLHNYLTSNPPLNKKVFHSLSSQSKDVSFNGIDYESSLKCLVGDLHESLKVNMNKFLELSKKLEGKYKLSDSTYKRIHGFYGSIPDIDAYLREKPNNMIRLERAKEAKVIEINFNLSYPFFTLDSQILNRGIITINLIKLLEKNNYRVRFNTFMLVRKYDEIIYVKVTLKKDNEQLNIGKCFFPLCCKEFLRRIMFRIIESKEVINDWASGYGSNIRASEIRDLLKIENDDIVITYPENMGIDGLNLFNDASKFMAKVNLKKYVKIKK